jgi:putative endonuclease
MKFYVYLIKSVVFDYTYVGHTEDLVGRLFEHNRGKTKSNKAYKPFVLVYSEGFSSREEAIQREKYFKTGSGREFLKSKMNLHP